MIRLDGGGGAREAIVELAAPPALDPWIERISIVSWPPELSGRPWLVVPDTSAHVLVHCCIDGHRTASVVGARRTAVRFQLGARRWTIAVRLRPGSLPALVRGDASTMTDRSRPLLPLGVVPRAVLHAETPRACAAALVTALGRTLAAGEVPDWRVRGLASAATGEHGSRRARVWEAARAMGVGERTLREVVRRETGLPPGTLLRIGRVLGAADRVVSTTDGLSRIAHRSGFADHAHFSHEFRLLMGEAPSRFRRRRWSAAGFDKPGAPGE